MELSHFTQAQMTNLLLRDALALSQALSNAYFDSIGLPRLAVSR
jgi:hypothetical protein